MEYGCWSSGRWAGDGYPLLHGARSVPAFDEDRHPPPFAILSAVLILYALYVACTVALVVAAAGIVRHIVRHRREVRSHTDHPDETI